MTMIKITLASSKAVKLVNTVDILKVYTPTQSKEHTDSNACIIYRQMHPTRVGSNEFDFAVETPEELWAMMSK
jgi:hypothetical protein